MTIINVPASLAPFSLKIHEALAAVDELRAKTEIVMKDMLRQAVLEIARDHKGHRVVGCSAMGFWTINVENLEWTVDGEKYIRDLEYVSCEPQEYEEEHAVLAVFDDVWDRISVYPTVRFVVDVDGTFTEETEW